MPKENSIANVMMTRLKSREDMSIFLPKISFLYMTRPLIGSRAAASVMKNGKD